MQVGDFFEQCQHGAHLGFGSQIQFAALFRLENAAGGGGGHKIIEIPLGNFHPFLPLQQHADAAVGHAQKSHHRSQHTDMVQVFRLRKFHRRVALGNHQQHLFRIVRLLDRFHRCALNHHQRGENARKQHGIFHNEQRQFIYNRVGIKWDAFII